MQKLKKSNFEENEPNYLEEEEYEEKNDPFMEFFKDSKLKKPSIEKEKEPKETSHMGSQTLPIRKKSYDDIKEKKTFEFEKLNKKLV